MIDTPGINDLPSWFSAMRAVETDNAALRAEIERLTRGAQEISRFLDENRLGDASFVCAALLASIDEQKPGSEGTT